MGRSCIILASLLLISARSATSDCSFTKEEDNWNQCIAVYECSGYIGNLVDDIKLTRNCMGARINYICDNTGHCVRQLHISTKFTLKVKGTNITSFDRSPNNIYFNISAYTYHMEMMTLINGDLTLIPEELFDLSKLTLLDVSHNKINKIDLKKCHSIENLNIFNASFNLISELETDTMHNRFVSNMTVIDLSHNAIEVIPDNYFTNFVQLLHLNMSYNLINCLNILTFEGLSELESLYLSNNKIQRIEMTFVRFSNLKELTLDHNDLSTIEENNFKMLTSLTKLSISFNKIINIDSLSFRNMPRLQSLNLNDNNIEVITKSMFLDNDALQQVNFANNRIHKIEPFSFKGTNITLCYFRNNALTNLDDKSIFDGIATEELDLSNSKINSIGDKVFQDLRSELRTLNLSHNLISHIHKNSFRALEFLTDLDLSNNKLPNIEFNMSDLINLSSFNAQNNLIKLLTKDTFRLTKSLIEINLSKNAIVEIETFSFYGLGELEVLDLSNNDLPSALAPHMFHGLSATKRLFLMCSKITSLQDAAFYSMTALTHLNASWSAIEVLEYNAFNGTENIRTLDLSHNHIKIFNVNNTHLKYVEQIFLNDNQIETITSQTLYGLLFLQDIYLKNNNILLVSVEAFRSLSTLSSLELSSNINLMFDASALSNISTLTNVSLSNVWKPFNFKTSMNTSILTLDLSSCNITDINSVMVYKLTKLETLLLKSNKLRYIDRYSFQNFSSLVYLDLSSNMISTIKPGTFAGTHEISFLNLHSNNLVSVSYGVFDGLSNLRVLNLSNNELHSFDGRLFHNSHKLSVIALDNNMIDNIDFKDLKTAGIPMITIGGNLIPCDVLVVSKKKHYYSVVVTSEIPNYHVENVDGVSCTGLHKVTNLNGQQTSREEKADTGKITDIVNAQNFGTVQNINNQLNTLKSAIYFEASCLFIIVCLLFMTLSFVYVKFRNNLIRTYSVNSRRHLTDSSMDMELYRTS